MARHRVAQLAWQRAENEMAKDDIIEPTSSVIYDEITKDDIIELTSSVIYNSPPAITRAASKLDKG